MRRALLFSVLLPCVLGAQAQPTLDECRELARGHYPEIRQYALIRRTAEYDLSNARRAWLRYAYGWLRENDPNGHLEMPGARVVSATAGGPAFLCRAVAQSDRVPYGMGIEETIRELWLGK